MSLEHAILGFLSYRPFSGYDLKKMFDTSVRHFWNADQSQIYRTLSRISENDWAEIEVIRQDDRPDRKVYHITDAGRQELLQWLRGPFSKEEPRSAPMIQVFFSAKLTNEEILAKMRTGLRYMKSMLERYSQIPAAIDEYAAMVGSEREVFCWMLTLESGIIMTRANIEWAESVIRRIENGEMPAA